MDELLVPAKAPRRRAAGKPPFLTPQLAQQIVALIEVGCTIDDTCASVGIAPATFYLWQQIGRDLAAGIRHAKAPRDADRQRLLMDFADRVTRAQAQARVLATAAVRRAFTEPAQTVTTIVEELEETRLRRDASGAQVPYTYRRRVTKTVTTQAPPDATMAVEYLKRRDPAHWSDRVAVRAEDWRSDAVAAIRSGEVDYPALAQALNDEALAADLFREAGIPIPTDSVQR